MSRLIMKLAPKERLLINGAVIENGDRRCRLSILTPGANILRMRDALHPDDVTTPVRRLCYSAQLVLSGDAEAEGTRQSMLRSIEELSQIFTDPDSRAVLAQASAAVVDANFYKCLKSLRALMPREDRLLSVARQ